MGNKGLEAALAAVEMASLGTAISSQPSAVSKKRAPARAQSSRKSIKKKGRRQSIS
jgi:hypothetical protein